MAMDDDNAGNAPDDVISLNAFFGLEKYVCIFATSEWKWKGNIGWFKENGSMFEEVGTLTKKQTRKIIRKREEYCLCRLMLTF